jgi:hypothetical protein
MDNFIIEEFTNYKVFLYGNNSDSGFNYSIHLSLPSGRAILWFGKAITIKNNIVQKGTKKIFNCYFDANSYYNFIDILRNEKPLFFFYDFEKNSCYLTTSDEPVGENE